MSTTEEDHPFARGYTVRPAHDSRTDAEAVERARFQALCESVTEKLSHYPDLPLSALLAGLLAHLGQRDAFALIEQAVASQVLVPEAIEEVLTVPLPTGKRSIVSP